MSHANTSTPVSSRIATAASRKMTIRDIASLGYHLLDGPKQRSGLCERACSCHSVVMTGRRRALSYLLTLAIFLLHGGICSAVFAAQAAVSKSAHHCCPKDKKSSQLPPECCPSAQKAAVNDSHSQDDSRPTILMLAFQPIAIALPIRLDRSRSLQHHHFPLSPPTATGAFFVPLLV